MPMEPQKGHLWDASIAGSRSSDYEDFRIGRLGSGRGTFGTSGASIEQQPPFMVSHVGRVS